MKKRRNIKSRIDVIWTVTKKVIGIILIIIGIIGTFLPILQGLLLIAIGIALYKNQSIEECVRYWENKVRKKLRELRIKSKIK